MPGRGGPRGPLGRWWNGEGTVEGCEGGVARALGSEYGTIKFLRNATLFPSLLFHLIVFHTLVHRTDTLTKREAERLEVEGGSSCVVERRLGNWKRAGGRRIRRSKTNLRWRTRFVLEDTPDTRRGAVRASKCIFDGRLTSF